MVPSIDPFYFVFADDLDEIADNEPESKKYLDAPKIKYYNLPNYQKFKAGEPNTWQSLLGEEYKAPVFQSGNRYGLTSSGVSSGAAGSVIALIGLGAVAYLVYRMRSSSDSVSSIRGYRR
jgi:hypothetical protein